MRRGRSPSARSSTSSILTVLSVLSSLSILPLVLAATPVLGAVHVVHPDGSGLYANIQAAVDAAADGDVIELTDGTFQGPGNGALDVGGKSLTFRSQSGSAERCVLALSGARFISSWGSGYSNGVEVVSLTFLQASGTYLYGRGIRFTSCIFLQCSGVANGGYCGIEFHSCLFLNATGSQAGVGENGSLLVDHCAVSGATATPFSTNHIRAIASRFEENDADCVIALEFTFFPGSADLDLCQFYDNRCDEAVLSAGGGMDAWLDAQLCTFTGNQGPVILADQRYGYQGGEVSLTSCTFADNEADDSPEILLISGQAPLSLALDRTILAFHEGGPAVACQGDFPVTVTATCADIFGNSGGDWTDCLAGLEGTGGNLSADPLFCRSLSSSPYMLRDDSPCLPDGSCGLIGAWGQGCAAAGVAESPAAGTPFLSCRPNPFAGSTQLVLARSPQSAARLEIFDASGRRVRSIDWPAGRASLSWDGADQAGRALPAGVYLYGMDGRSGRFLLLR